ncbi:MAG: ribosome maturation factor RimM, partial [Anaerolineae bacterium]
MSENQSRQLGRGRGSAKQDVEPRFLVIGEITKPHGVRGEVRVRPHTDLPERFGWLTQVYVGQTDPQLLQVESIRWHKDVLLLKFAGLDNRDDIEGFRGQYLQVLESEAIPLAEGEYFLYQLIGLRVVSDEGQELGELKQVVETGANNVFVVQGEAGEWLLPDIPEVALDIDFDDDFLAKFESSCA